MVCKRSTVDKPQQFLRTAASYGTSFSRSSWIRSLCVFECIICLESNSSSRRNINRFSGRRNSTGAWLGHVTVKGSKARQSRLFAVDHRFHNRVKDRVYNSFRFRNREIVSGSHLLDYSSFVDGFFFARANRGRHRLGFRTRSETENARHHS